MNCWAGLIRVRVKLDRVCMLHIVCVLNPLYMNTDSLSKERGRENAKGARVWFQKTKKKRKNLIHRNIIVMLCKQHYNNQLCKPYSMFFRTFLPFLRMSIMRMFCIENILSPGFFSSPKIILVRRKYVNVCKWVKTEQCTPSEWKPIDGNAGQIY